MDVEQPSLDVTQHVHPPRTSTPHAHTLPHMEVQPIENVIGQTLPDGRITTTFYGGIPAKSGMCSIPSLVVSLFTITSVIDNANVCAMEITKGVPPRSLKCKAPSLEDNVVAANFRSNPVFVDSVVLSHLKLKKQARLKAELNASSSNNSPCSLVAMVASHQLPPHSP
uniref:Uncharacterized protein n=1 Tax=Nelumbo nucifera TaxID=4432 RepID=A0A822YD32_NELNU|nr:TPA_asm: hypothetical protein HUJ06_030434 [Nelumbo nucifera]